MPKLIAKWNSVRDVWEIPNTEGLLCEHLAVYSETFPTSVMTVAGTLYERPMSARLEHGNRNGHGKSLEIEAQRLLPTPSAAEGGKTSRSGDRIGEPLIGGIVRDNLWGDYAAAITRWEHVLGRPAPAPTMTSSKGNPQLSPAFVEWMMGMPAGWVTDAPGITRNEALKALGNGVVPQQAAAALRTMLAWEAVA